MRIPRALRHSAIIAFILAMAACGRTNPLNMTLEMDENSGNAAISIRNNTQHTISFSTRLFDKLKNERGQISVVVETEQGDAVEMCRGLDYFGQEKPLYVAGGQTTSLPFHVSAIVQTHCLSPGKMYYVSAQLGPIREIGLVDAISSNKIELQTE